MAIQTDIEYADSTVNGQMGCDGCELWNARNKSCYAGRITEAQKGRKGWPASFTRPEIFPGRIEQAARWPDLTGTQRPYKPWLDMYPRIIFLNDMGDTFTKSLPLDWLLPYISIIENSRHIWLILTKNGSRMVKFFNEVLGYVPSNVWPGVTITSKKTITRLDYLLQLPATAIRWISVEPYLAPIAFPDDMFDLVDWLVVGGASDPDGPPLHPGDVRALRDRCLGKQTSFFFKQWGECRPLETDDEVRFERIGKAAAGRRLDGRTWSALPQYKPTGQMVLL
jgi:protein gp37